MSEHPNNQLNRDRAKGCCVTFHFRDGTTHVRSFLPDSWNFSDAEEPKEVFWRDGFNMIYDMLDQKFIRTESSFMNVSEIRKVTWREFAPLWNGNFPYDPNSDPWKELATPPESE